MTFIRNRAAFILAAFAIVGLTASCQTTTELKSSTPNSSATATPVPTNQPEVTKTETSAPSDGASLATPTETYKAGYTARQKKDLATLKRVLSKDALEFLTEIGKEEKKTLDDQLRTLAERPQGPTMESRNEKINGNRASLEYLNESGKWTAMEFVKEGADWKIDLPKAQ